MNKIISVVFLFLIFFICYIVFHFQLYSSFHPITKEEGISFLYKNDFQFIGSDHSFPLEENFYGMKSCFNFTQGIISIRKITNDLKVIDHLCIHRFLRKKKLSIQLIQYFLFNLSNTKYLPCIILMKQEKTTENFLQSLVTTVLTKLMKQVMITKIGTIQGYKLSFPNSLNKNLQNHPMIFSTTIGYINIQYYKHDQVNNSLNDQLNNLFNDQIYLFCDKSNHQQFQDEIQQQLLHNQKTFISNLLFSCKYSF